MTGIPAESRPIRPQKLYEQVSARLEARIIEESQRPMPDTATLGRLKKEKLRVKEEISRL